MKYAAKTLMTGPATVVLLIFSAGRPSPAYAPGQNLLVDEERVRIYYQSTARFDNVRAVAE